jgi:ABC-type phosphate/phosphonate transport system substrate-binding protein
VSGFIANARMYAVSPEAESTWERLIACIAEDARVPLRYESYPAPKPLEELWRRADLGCVQMCGYPIALRIADVQPIAAPIPALPWAAGRAVYRTDLIVRADSPFGRLEDTFGHRIGWTAAHSHSGFNAPRHHLLPHWRARGAPLFREAKGDLVTARRVLDAVLDGSIEVGPLDGYWHALIARYRPGLAAGTRVLDVTDLAPMPAFVAAPSLPAAAIARLRAAFVAAAARPWFADFAEPLLIAGFETVNHATFSTTLAWDREAVAAGYLVPG